MIKTEIFEFGNRNNFCIRLGPSKKPKKFYLQFWLKNLEMGNFKKADILQISLDALQKLLLKRESMSQTSLSDMTKQEIWNYISDLSIGMNGIRSRFNLLYDAGVYPIFGGQFSNQQRRDIVLADLESFRFIWQNDFGQPINEVKIKIRDFTEVFEEFKTYCGINKLI